MIFLFSAQDPPNVRATAFSAICVLRLAELHQWQLFYSTVCATGIQGIIGDSYGNAAKRQRRRSRYLPAARPDDKSRRKFPFVRSQTVFERLGPSSPTARSDIRRLLVVNRRRVAGAARLPGSTERVEIVFMPGALARVVVNEGPAPRIFRHVCSLQIGPVPAGDPGRTIDQGEEALLRRRIGPDIQLVDIKHTGYALDRLVGDFFFRGFELPERGGCDKSDQQPEDGEHDEKLEQGETPLPPAPILGEVDRITPERWGPQVRPPSGRPSNQTKLEDHRVMRLVE